MLMKAALTQWQSLQLTPRMPTQTGVQPHTHSYDVKQVCARCTLLKLVDTHTLCLYAEMFSHGVYKHSGADAQSAQALLQYLYRMTNTLVRMNKRFREVIARKRSAAGDREAAQDLQDEQRALDARVEVIKGFLGMCSHLTCSFLFLIAGPCFHHLVM